jgi:hypothetical protein
MRTQARTQHLRRGFGCKSAAFPLAVPLLVKWDLSPTDYGCQAPSGPERIFSAISCSLLDPERVLLGVPLARGMPTAS